MRFNDVMKSSKFMVIRPPVERLSSAFFDKFLVPSVNNIPPEPFVDEFLKKNNFKLNNICLFDFIKTCLKSDPRSLNDHFRPQSWMIAFDTYDLILPMNKLKEISFLSINDKTIPLPKPRNVNVLAKDPVSTARESNIDEKLRDISSTSISQLVDQIAQGTLKLPSARVWTQENTGINIEESKYYKIDSLVFNEAVKNFEKNIIIR